MGATQKDMVDRIAARQMGVEPEQAQQAAAQQAAAEQQGRQAQQQSQQRQAAKQTNEEKGKDTEQDQAAEEGSPETEGDKMAADAIIYSVDFGDGNERKLTPQQIKSTFERYSAMNYKNAQYKPVMDIVEQIMSENPGMDSKQLAEQMQNAYKAQQSNPTMGNTDGEKSGEYRETQAKEAGDIDSMLKQWEEDNAASLPPGYKDVIVGGQQSMQSMQQQLNQTQQMLQQVLAQSQGVADAARQGVQQGQQQQVDSVRQQIGNNIDRVQQALQLPDDKAEDFMTFAAERGFTLEDFVDPQLTVKVMQDFKNNMDSPEMERMRQIAQRRQAYTGSLGSTPSATPGAEASQPQGESRLDQMAQSIMSRRGMA